MDLQEIDTEFCAITQISFRFKGISISMDRGLCVLRLPSRLMRMKLRPTGFLHFYCDDGVNAGSTDEERLFQQRTPRVPVAAAAVGIPLPGPLDVSSAQGRVRSGRKTKSLPPSEGKRDNPSQRQITEGKRENPRKRHNLEGKRNNPQTPPSLCNAEGKRENPLLRHPKVALAATGHISNVVTFGDFAPVALLPLSQIPVHRPLRWADSSDSADSDTGCVPKSQAPLFASVESQTSTVVSCCDFAMQCDVTSQEVSTQTRVSVFGTSDSSTQHDVLTSEVSVQTLPPVVCEISTQASVITRDFCGGVDMDGEFRTQLAGFAAKHAQAIAANRLFEEENTKVHEANRDLGAYARELAQELEVLRGKLKQYEDLMFEYKNTNEELCVENARLVGENSKLSGFCLQHRSDNEILVAKIKADAVVHDNTAILYKRCNDALEKSNRTRDAFFTALAQTKRNYENIVMLWSPHIINLLNNAKSIKKKQPYDATDVPPPSPERVLRLLRDTWPDKVFPDLL